MQFPRVFRSRLFGLVALAAFATPLAACGSADSGPNNPCQRMLSTPFSVADPAGSETAQDAVTYLASDARTKCMAKALKVATIGIRHELTALGSPIGFTHIVRYTDGGKDMPKHYTGQGTIGTADGAIYLHGTWNDGDLTTITEFALSNEQHAPGSKVVFTRAVTADYWIISTNDPYTQVMSIGSYQGFRTAPNEASPLPKDSNRYYPSTLSSLRDVDQIGIREWSADSWKLSHGDWALL